MNHHYRYLLGRCSRCRRALVFVAAASSANCPDCGHRNELHAQSSTFELKKSGEALAAQEIQNFASSIRQLGDFVANHTPSHDREESPATVTAEAVGIVRQISEIFLGPQEITPHHFDLVSGIVLQYGKDFDLSAAFPVIHAMHSFQVVSTPTGAALGWVGSNPFILFEAEGADAKAGISYLDFAIQILAGISGVVLGVRLGRPGARAFARLGRLLMGDRRFRNLLDALIKDLVESLNTSRFGNAMSRLQNLVKFLFRQYAEHLTQALKEAGTPILSGCLVIAALVKWIADLFGVEEKLEGKLIPIAGGLGWAVARGLATFRS